MSRSLERRPFGEVLGETLICTTETINSDGHRVDSFSVDQAAGNAVWFAGMFCLGWFCTNKKILQ